MATYVFAAARRDDDALDVAIERRNIHLVTVPTDVRFDPLRSHPRFQDLLRRMNLS